MTEIKRYQNDHAVNHTNTARLNEYEAVLDTLANFGGTLEQARALAAKTIEKDFNNTSIEPNFLPLKPGDLERWISYAMENFPQYDSLFIVQTKTDYSVAYDTQGLLELVNQNAGMEMLVTEHFYE